LAYSLTVGQAFGPASQQELITDAAIGAGYLAGVAFPPAAGVAAAAQALIALDRFNKMGGFNDCDKFAKKTSNQIITIIKSAIDPNDKSGNQGVTSAHVIRGKDGLQYLVSFENTATATLAAQTVTVTDSLDPAKFESELDSVWPGRIRGHVCRALSIG